MSIPDLLALRQRGQPQAAGKPQPRTVQLQANRTGLYHTLVEFDAGDEHAERAVREAVELLCSVDAALACRVVMKSVSADVLLNYSVRHGWTPGK